MVQASVATAATVLGSTSPQRRLRCLHMRDQVFHLRAERVAVGVKRRSDFNCCRGPSRVAQLAERRMQTLGWLRRSTAERGSGRGRSIRRVGLGCDRLANKQFVNAHRKPKTNLKDAFHRSLHWSWRAIDWVGPRLSSEYCCRSGVKRSRTTLLAGVVDVGACWRRQQTHPPRCGPCS